MRKVENVLVTGGAGFMGSNFIRHLLGNDIFRVVNLDLLTYAADLRNLQFCEKDPRYSFVQGDIRDEKLVLELLDKYDVDTIVHFAAETHVDNSIVNPRSFIETNVNGTFSLLEAVRKRIRVHFHHISTDEVYGSLDSGYFSEESPYHPNSPYAASKAASDHLVRSYGSTYSISYTISHSTNNYGPHQHGEKFIPLMIKNLLLGKELPIYGTGENRRDWLFVEDHAEAVWKILLLGKSGEMYDVGGGNEMSNLDIVDHLSKCLNIGPKVNFVKDRLGHDFRYAIEARKIREELGWKPGYSLKEGLKATVDWYAKRI